MTPLAQAEPTHLDIGLGKHAQVEFHAQNVGELL